VARAEGWKAAGAIFDLNPHLEFMRTLVALESRGFTKMLESPGFKRALERLENTVRDPHSSDEYRMAARVALAHVHLAMNDPTEALEAVASIQETVVTLPLVLEVQLRALRALHHQSEARQLEAMRLLGSDQVAPLQKLALYSSLPSLDKKHFVVATNLISSLAATLEPKLRAGFVTYWHAQLEPRPAFSATP
jgi:hypothetical protein